MSKRNQRLLKQFQAERLTASASLITATRQDTNAAQSFNLVAVLIGLIVAWFH